jgi:hypothetical protein
MLKFLCEDGHANETLAKILAAPALGTDCSCCLGTRIWAALIIGVVVGAFI